jgi:hypothetical protein
MDSKENRFEYYEYDGEIYTATFPLEWAKTHQVNTGPKNCKNCAYYGSWNGVFIGYCVNCARYKYMGYRGCGFIYLGIQFKTDHVFDTVKSVFDTYLKGIDMNNIGRSDII